MGKCSLENCKNECFEQEDKCILHCHKNENNGWYTLDKDNKKIWDDYKVNLFWNSIQSYLNSTYINYRIDPDLIEKKYILSNVIFPKFQDEVEYFSPADNEDEMGTNFYSYRVFKHPNKQSMPEVNTFFTKLIVSFDSCTFLDIANFEKYNFEQDIVFDKCTFKDALLLNRLYKKRVSFLHCEIDKLDLSDIVFVDFVDFAGTTFKNKVLFRDTTFEAGVAFVKCKFKDKANFTYTSFEDKTFFNEAKFSKKINLETATFYKDVDFLKIKTEVANRETARKIKDSFEKQNNIIEANRFYAKEMEEREKELNQDVLKGKSISEWLIFKVHSISSDHSQSWFLALLWILIVSMLYSLIAQNISFNQDIVNASAVFGVLALCTIFCIEEKNKKYLSSFLLFILLLVNYSVIVENPFDCLADKINPFSIMTSWDKIYFFDLIFKVIIAYLIYQFIISVRQNTRRK